MKRMFKGVCGLVFSALMGMAAIDASAQAWPSKPITFYISIGPGSVFESTFRMLAAEVSKTLGQPIVVENKVGAGGKIGLQALMSSPADGYTIGMTFNGVVVTRAILDEGFAVLPGKDYAPVTISYSSPLAIVANASAPFKDMSGLLAYAKANPGKLSVSGASPSSNSHLSWELLKTLTGLDINVVTHRAEAQAVVDLLNGSVMAMVASTSVKPLIETGKLIGIATTASRRWNAFPALPTIEESGVKGFNVFGWYGIVAPAGTPAPIVNRLHDAFTRALSAPDIKKRIEEASMIPGGATPEEFTAQVRADLDRWRPIMQKAKLKLE